MGDLNVASVLIVDDAAFSRRMLRKYLEAEGCQVLEATNGQQALDMIQQQQPDCILTDLLMPDIDGFQLLQALREQGCTKLNLSLAYPVVIGLTVIFTTLTGAFLLDEKVLPVQWLGIGLMVSGISAIAFGKIG